VVLSSPISDVRLSSPSRLLLHVGGDVGVVDILVKTTAAAARPGPCGSHQRAQEVPDLLPPTRRHHNAQTSRDHGLVPVSSVTFCDIVPLEARGGEVLGAQPPPLVTLPHRQAYNPPGSPRYGRRRAGCRCCMPPYLRNDIGDRNPRATSAPGRGQWGNSLMGRELERCGVRVLGGDGRSQTTIFRLGYEISCVTRRLLLGRGRVGEGRAAGG
jgi:hypothetical protein